MDKKIIIAPIDEDSDEKVLFSPIKEFPIERVILLTATEGVVKAEKFKQNLENLSIPVSIVKVKHTGNPWEDFFSLVPEVVEGQDKNNIIINISTADRISQCALTNAAHINGIKAVAVINNNMILLPIIRLSFSNVLSDKKINILKQLEKNKCFSSLEDLAKATGISLQLMAYHIHGTDKSPGLENLGLAETKDVKGKVRVCISTMGKLFMKGFIG